MYRNKSVAFITFTEPSSLEWPSNMVTVADLVLHYELSPSELNGTLEFICSLWLWKHMFEQFKKSCHFTTNITVSRCIIYISLCLILLLSDIFACIFQSQCWNVFMFHVIFIKYEWGSSIEDGSGGFFSFIVRLYNILSYLNWAFCLKM